MADLPLDQADGLRKLFKPTLIPSISVGGGRGGTGTTSVVINLAHALCRTGKRVLVLDEFAGNGNVMARLGFNSLLDLPTALKRRLPLEEILVDGPDGLLILPLAADANSLARLSMEEQYQLSSSFSQITRLADIILLDARTPAGPHVPSLSLAASDCLIVVSNRPESITDAYAHIKLLSTNYGRHEFRILVTRVERLDDAKEIFNRIRHVARRYMPVKLSLIGYIPQDEKLHHANRLLKPVALAHPDSEAAIAFEQIANAFLKYLPKSSSDYHPAQFIDYLIEGSRVMIKDLQI